MKTRTWSIVAFVLSLLICVVAVITSLIDDATYFSRLHTTIIYWNLPLVAMGVIVYSFISERDETTSNAMAWLAVCFMAIAMFCTNITKNVAQDVCSNIENYVDMTTSVIDDESGNLKDYVDKLKKSIDAAAERYENDKRSERREMKDSKKDTPRYVVPPRYTKYDSDRDYQVATGEAR